SLKEASGFLQQASEWESHRTHQACGQSLPLLASSMACLFFESFFEKRDYFTRATGKRTRTSFAYVFTRNIIQTPPKPKIRFGNHAATTGSRRLMPPSLSKSSNVDQ